MQRVFIIRTKKDENAVKTNEFCVKLMGKCFLFDKQNSVTK